LVGSGVAGHRVHKRAANGVDGSITGDVIDGGRIRGHRIGGDGDSVGVDGYGDRARCVIWVDSDVTGNKIGRGGVGIGWGDGSGGEFSWFGLQGGVCDRT